MKYYNLTIPQQNIWNLQKYYEDTTISNVCGAVFFEEKRDSLILQQAIYQFIRSQSGLRLRFCVKTEPKQYVSDEISGSIPIMKFATKEEFDYYAEKFAKESIGLIECPMYRFVVFHLKNRSGILALLSHLVSDAWTFGLMANQIDVAYRRLAEGTEVSLLEGNYIDFVQAEKSYLMSVRCEKDKSYWEGNYTVRPEKSPIKVYPLQADRAEAKRVMRTLPLSLEREIAEYCRIHSISQAVLFETALITYLSKINQENQSITIGVLVLNRSNAKEKNIAGMFVSTMPLTVSLTGDTVISDLEKKITRGHMDLFRHQKYPYTNILKSLRRTYDFSGNLYDVMFSYQNAKTYTSADTKWYSNGYSEVPFVMHIDNRDGNECHTINVDYQTTVFKDELEVKIIIERLEYILNQIIEDDKKHVSDICIIPKQELKKLVYEFNDTYIKYEREKCVHELFSQQVVRNPDKIALLFENEKFTYLQLDEMSNSLAHFLRDNGVKPNDVVPIIAERGWHIIVAMLGVLKAGGAFTSIDVTYPKERIESILENTRAKVVLIFNYKYLKNCTDKMVINLSSFDFWRNSKEIDNVNVCDDLCYVVYTSGTTGKPKGLSICHSNGTNFCNKNKFNINSKIVDDSKETIFLSITNTVFDMFITELFIPLTSGMTILFANKKEALIDEQLELICKRMSPDIIETTPTKLKMLLASGKFKSIENFKAIILGGEPLTKVFYNYLKKKTNAKIFNNYGPAETTVWSTISEIVDEDITIGKPIANTQIYILDKNSNLLPIGVAGELCIAGEGVGKGYLHQIELTTERFVLNPFATRENGHGKIMYHTGDLARWRMDGELEYLGRIDTQVKIRGLRIELGEIENVMGNVEGIELVAVAEKRDENERQYLVGYYTADTEIDERELRNYLSKKLPQYMIPNYFMRLDSMLVTTTGKIDRKNLPLPNFMIQATEYVVPVTEREKKLCHLLEELLYIPQIGITDDFFELGGDSLMAIEYVAKAHDMGIDFALQNIFDYPTVQSLCCFLKKESAPRVQYENCDFDKYQSLFEENVINETFLPEKRSLGNILLIGVTGFLGAHVLNQLMKEETGKIYCLVRSRKSIDYCERIREILRYYFKNRYEAEIGKRIIPIEGDIEEKNLAERMPKDVCTVIHTAANVKHYGSYDYFYSVNVEGTRHVINYAKSIGARLIHISTLSVSGNGLADDFSVFQSDEDKDFCETSLYVGQCLDNVYVHSKFEAEKAVYDAILEGLDAKVIRVGNLTNRVSDYKFQINYIENAFLTRIKAILEFGLFPDYLIHLYAEFSPVDLTAEGIIKIAQYADKQSVFHLYNNHPIYFECLLEELHELGIFIKVVNGEFFHEALEKTIRNSGTKYIYKAFQNDMDEQGRLVYDSNIHIKNEFTIWFLKRVGFEWNEIDIEYIKGYVNYFREIGYLKV